MSNNEPKRILIVDDEPNFAKMLSISLRKLGKEFTFDTAHNGGEALLKLKQATYSLLITDYNMPDMTGLDLASMVRQVSPGTQVVLMTAFGTDMLRDKIAKAKLDAFIDKPFDLNQIREIVKGVVDRAQDQRDKEARSAEDKYRAGQKVVNDAVHEHIKSLQQQTGARSVLLLSSSGYPVDVIGQTKDFDVSSVSALVAANFLAAKELANLLGSPNSVFKSSYHEGNDYNIYAYDIDGNLMLAVIFGAESKPGIVWFYTKQVAAELKPLVAKPAEKVTLNIKDVSDALGADLDDLLGL